MNDGTFKGAGPDCLRNELIGETLRWARDRSPFYAQSFNHLDFRNVWTVESLSKVPILTREKVREAGESILCTGLHISHLQNTSGTSGEPLLLYRSIEETQFIRAFFSEVNASSEDCLPLVLNLTVPHHGTGTPIPSRVCVLESGVADQELLDHTLLVLRKAFHLPGVGERVIALSGSHSQMLALTNYCIEQGIDSSSFQIRYLHITGQHLTSRWKQVLEHFWNAKVIDRYSLSEIFGGATYCQYCSGFHFDPLVIPELVRIDQHTSMTNGVGMLLLTTLYPFVQMQPLIRYATGDVFEVTETSCPTRSFYFKGRLNQCLFDPTDASCILIAATDLFDIVDQFPEVRRQAQFKDMPLAYHEATGRPILSASYALDGPTLRLQIQIEFSFTPQLYQNRVNEILARIRSMIIAKSQALSEQMSAGAVALDLIPTGPGSLRPVVKNSGLWQCKEKPIPCQ